MDSDNDSDVGDLLDDLLASNENSECKSSKSETALKELDFNFLETASNSIETSSPKKFKNSTKNENFDSSDDEDKRYFEHQKYSSVGREIKDVLKRVESEKKDLFVTREVLHGSKQPFDFNNAKGNISQSSNLSKSNISQLNTKSSPVSTNSSSNDVYSDPIFGLRIVKPLISSAELKDRMLGRTPVRVSNVKKHLATANLQDDWVIAGVVISKSPVMKSQKGSQYCIWKISDLSFDMNVVSLFLFSGAYKGLWKTNPGAVIGILNPNVLESKDDKDQATLSVDNAQKVMILGNSRDMGICKSMTKSGKPCTAIVNKNRCEFCVYHVQKEYKQCARRADIQSSANGRSFGSSLANGKSFGPKKIQAAITQGQSQNFVGVPARRNQKLYQKDCERLALLTRGKKIEEKKEENLKDEMQNFEKKNKIPDDKNLIVSKNEEKNEVKRQMVELSSNQMKKDIDRLNKLKGLANRGEKEVKTSKEVLNESAEKLTSECLNSTKKESSNIIKLQESTADDESSSFLSKTPGFTRSKLQEWTMKQGFGISPSNDSQTKPLNLNGLSRSSNSKFTKSLSKLGCHSNSSSQNSRSESLDSPSNPTLSFPRLANGNTSGSIDFSEPITKKQMNSAKLNALNWVRKNGGIKSSNPNKILLSKEKKEQGLKRKREPENEECIKLTKSEKLLPNKFKELMEATSSHVNLIEQSDEKEKEKYFGKLEMKEKMEEKMMTTFKVPCKAVICLICKYTAFSGSDMCKELRHPLKVIDTIKRFFKCGDCGNRTVCLDKIPTLSCTKCSSSNWKRAAMMDEKKTAIPGAALSLRGGEEKYIGSYVQDANLNLLVPE